MFQPVNITIFLALGLALGCSSKLELERDVKDKAPLAGQEAENQQTETTTEKQPTQSSDLIVVKKKDSSQASTTSSALNLEVEGEGIAEYQYDLLEGKLDDCAPAEYGAWNSILDPITAELPKAGQYTVCVLGRDDEQNQQKEPTIILVQRFLPIATLTGFPDLISNATDLDITVAGPGVSEYSFDLLTASADCSTATYTVWTSVETKISSSLAGDSDYRLCVKGRSDENATQEVATSFAWTKDTVAPTATLSGTPTDPSGALSLDVTVVGVQVESYKYGVVVGVATCSSAVYSDATPIATKITAALGADNTHRLCVKGTDAAGNEQLVATESVWVKDTLAPAATLSGTPTDPSAATSLNVDVAGADVAEYKYDILGASAANCDAASYGSWVDASVNITDALGIDDTLRICVIGRDEALNEQASATTYSWAKDTAAPTATISTAPADPSNDTTLNVNVGGTDVYEYIYDVIGGGVADCSTAVYSGWISESVNITSAIGSDDTYRLCVIGRDGLLNTQATPSTYVWTKDATPNDASLSGTPANTSSDTALDVTVGGTGVTNYKYDVLAAGGNCSGAIYSGAFPIATKITEALGADDSYRLCVKGIDAAGNEQIVYTSYLWTKDTTAPTATISGQPSDPSNATTFNVDVAGTDVAEYKYDWLGGSVADCSTASYSGWIAASTNITDTIGGDDTYRLCVVGRDAAQNEQATATQHSWTKDTVAPSAGVSGTPTAVSGIAVLDIAVTGAGVVDYQYDILTGGAPNCSTASYGSFTAVSNKITDVLPTSGAHRLCVQGRDAAGNVQSTAVEFSWVKINAASISFSSFHHRLDNDGNNELIKQPDGKILAIVPFETAAGGYHKQDLGVIRFNNDLSIDTSFGTSGKVVIDRTYMESAEDGGNIAVYNNGTGNDGKILVTGVKVIQTASCVGEFFAVRLNANGTVDTSFGTSGYYQGGLQFNGDGTSGPVPWNTTGGACTDNRGIMSARGTFPIIQSDDSVIIAMSAFAGSHAEMYFLKLSATGAPVGSFNNTGYNGWVRMNGPASGSWNMIMEAKPLSTGEIAVGALNYNGSSIYEMLYYQLNPNGTLDTSIETAGDNYVTLQVYGNNDYLRGMSIQPDDKPVLTGIWVDGSSDGYSGMVRLNTDGTLDTSFNSTGIYEVNPPLSAQTPYGDQYWDIAFDASNRIVAVGDNRKDATYRNGQISRFTTAGVPDTSYGTNGHTTVSNTNSTLYRGLIHEGNNVFITIQGMSDASSDYSGYSLERIVLAP